MNSENITARLSVCYTGALHDVMRGMGLTHFVLPREIRPLDPSQKLAGPIMTIEGRTGTFDAHETLMGWTGLLSKARPGHVLLCQPHNDTVALMGELSGETLKRKGVRGYFVDGGSRDCDFLLEMGFATWHRFFSPKDIVGAWLPERFDGPIKIGDVTIASGDYFLGDRDGAIVIPAAQIETILGAAEQAMNTENKVRTAILAGMDPQEAYVKYGKF
jgi:4-hydroxy-4-methyl-2-oxoglutarate aldolase